VWPRPPAEERLKQMESIRAFAAEQGWDVEFYDLGISATFRKRNDKRDQRVAFGRRIKTKVPQLDQMRVEDI